MMRAPRFRYYAARNAADAAAALADAPDAILLAGGTDVVPKLKRRQVTPSLVISLRRAGDLRGIAANGEMTIGPMTTLRDVIDDGRTGELNALYSAVSQIATPLIRNTATLGGNLALDTRCNYYDQSEEWRTAIGGCMKLPVVGCQLPVAGGEESALAIVNHGSSTVPQATDNRQPTTPPCWVAPSSPRCWAVSSSDGAPALIALGARVTLLSTRGERDVALEDLYADDGAAPLAKQRDEVLTAIRIPRGWRSAYWKLRRRGSFDFPVLGVAAALRFDIHGAVSDARIVLGAVASRPLLLADSQSLCGSILTNTVIESFADRAAVHAKPLDNTDFHMTWRKSVARTFLAGVLRELRGDPPASLSPFVRHATGGFL